MARYSKASQDALSWKSMQYWNGVSAQLRQRDAQRARQNQGTIEKEQSSYMAKKDVSAAEIADVLKIVRGNPAAAARLTELITSGQVEVGVGADGRLSVRADEVASSAPASTTGTSLTSTMKPSAPQLSGSELAKAVSAHANTQDYKIALERKRSNRDMTSAQRAALTKMGQLEALTNAEARAEKPPLPGTYKSQKTYVSSRIQGIAKLPPFEQVNAAREYRAELRRHPAFLDERHAEHKQILEEVRRTYGAEFYKDNTPVLPDENK